jgi:hypothetical protein
MDHPTPQRFVPELEPDETLEAYFAATHKLEHEDASGLNRHAFAMAINRSRATPGGVASDNGPMVRCHQSRSADTHNQRGNLGAVLTIFECLIRNEAQDHEVTLYTAEDYILGPRSLVRTWIADRKKRSVRDLYEKLLPYVSDAAWPRVHLMRQPKGGLHGQRRDYALALANGELFPSIK